jgi:BirA family biotin operon repressor/biotin-[acetyl-CoA-carboxylase] ligase
MLILTNFAVKLFQMNIVKVDATNSTNALAKNLNQKNQSENFCVSADFQSHGRGQQQSVWESSKAENLMFTLVYNRLELEVKHQFILNALVCLNMYKVLKIYNVKNTFLKWPNDILADNKKICGILIGNSLIGQKIKTSYVGIGLNVNQEKFDKLPDAGSLKNILGKRLNRNKLLEDLITQFKNIPAQLHTLQKSEILKDYRSKLYGFNQISKFSLNNESVEGKIQDVKSSGELIVCFSEHKVLGFQHKEIKQLF